MMIGVKGQKLFQEPYYLTNETPWRWVFLRNLLSLSYSRISQIFMVLEYWLPRSPEPHTGPNPERYESSTYYSNLFISDHFNIVTWCLKVGSVLSEKHSRDVCCWSTASWNTFPRLRVRWYESRSRIRETRDKSEIQRAVRDSLSRSSLCELL
jgi:hypothetical protein